jgi:cbb3-type cytochrome oxidase subunit 3
MNPSITDPLIIAALGMCAFGAIFLIWALRKENKNEADSVRQPEKNDKAGNP